ncbi:hypothetical protein [Shinella zoogloeoides]
MQSEVFHVSRSSDGQREWYSARDAATGVSIPCECKDRAIALVTSLNSAFKHHLTAALSDQERAVEVKGLEIDELIEEMLDAQQDINLAANSHMDQSLCDASALIDRVEAFLLRIRSALVDVPVEPVAYLRLENRTDIDGETYTGLQLSDVSDERAFPVYTRPPHREGEDSAEVERLRRESEILRGVFNDVLDWAERRCPCHNEEPNPCPLCGASVENLEACKSAENTLPRGLLIDLRIARSLIAASATTVKGAADHG